MKLLELNLIESMRIAVRPVSIVICLFLISLCLSGCALNNEIVIKSKNDYQRTFMAGGFEFVFPHNSKIHFLPLQGSAWVLSGDISEIYRDVVAEFEAKQSHSHSATTVSQLNIQELTINYGDRRIGGTVSDPGIRLSMAYNGKYDGQVIESCEPLEVIPQHQPPVEHGLFANRDEIRVMIQPVFEKLIADALDEAIFLSLICLSQEAIASSTGKRSKR